MASRFTLLDFLGRWLLCAALVFSTYNPTQYSYVSWISGEGMEFGPVPAIVSIVLLIAWIIFLRATFMAMGILGIALSAALFGCLGWLLVDMGALSLESGHTLIWLILLVASLVLATGLSWAHIRRRLSGQVSVDDVED
jgi:Family of unknown function (DUF6524)